MFLGEGAGKLKEGEEIVCEFVAASSDAAKVVEAVEEGLDEVAGAILNAVKRARMAVGRSHALDLLGVVEFSKSSGSAPRGALNKAWMPSDFIDDQSKCIARKSV